MQGLQVLATCSSFLSQNADESLCFSGEAYPVLSEETAQLLLQHVQACATAAMEQCKSPSGLPLLKCKVSSLAMSA